MVEQDLLSFYSYTLYENNLLGQIITLIQYTKNGFNLHYNTEHKNFEEIEINGHSGLFVDFSNDEYNNSIVVWDNGDYVLQLSGDLDKNDLYNLVKSVKVLEN